MTTREFQKAQALAQSWTAQPFDPQTREDVRVLLQSGNKDEVMDSFGADLEFGTAGLRGLLGAGTLRMNPYTVGRAAFGVGEALKRHHPALGEGGVVVGYDCRHRSEEFARVTASVLIHLGLPVHLFNRQVGTPLVPFMVRRLKAAAGIMVTSSHNPKEYNGFKVYNNVGSQIIAPWDSQISTAMSAVDYSDIASLELNLGEDSPLLRYLGQRQIDEYISWAVDTSQIRGTHPVALVYSPLGGTGAPFVREILRRRGFQNVHIVPEEAEPDPEFAGLPGPNPERKDVWERSILLARKYNADIALATDGDSDRIGAAVRTPGGEYPLLTGNQIGCGMLFYLLEARSDAGALTGDELALCSAVSSPLTQKIIEGFGGRFIETLTGFKWMGTVAEQQVREGADFILAYEEAFGVTFGESRDKDGMTAVALLAEMAAWARSRGETIFDIANRMYERFGVHWEGAAENKYLGLNGQQVMAAILDGLRSTPPREIAGSPVIRLRDLLNQVVHENQESQPFTDLPPQNLLTFTLDDGSWISIRPSGTEPKIKAYVGVAYPPSGESVDKSLLKAQDRVSELEQAAKGMLSAD